MASAALVTRLALSEPIALVTWLAVSLAAITLVRSDPIASAAIALAGGIVIGLSRVIAGSGARQRNDAAGTGEAAKPLDTARTSRVERQRDDTAGAAGQVPPRVDEAGLNEVERRHDDSARATGHRPNIIKSAAVWLDRNELLLLIAASPFFLFPLRPFTPVIVLVPLLWFSRWLARGYVTRRSPLNLPVLCLLVMLIPATIAAQDPALSLAKLVGLIFGVGIYGAILNAPAGDITTKAADVLVWLALGIGVAALAGTDWPAVGKLSIYDRIYQALPRLISELPRSISSTGLINPNEVGGVLAWTLPFVIGVWMAGGLQPAARPWARLGASPRQAGSRTDRHRVIAGSIARQIALGLTMALNAATLFLTQSRSAIGGVTLALLALIGIYQVWFRVLLIVAGLAAAFGAFTLGPERVSDLIMRAGDERLSTVPELTLSGRLTIWEEGIEVARQHAGTGIGLNNFDLVRSSVGVDSSPELQKRLVIHAHNEFLAAAVELGLPGLVAYTALLASAFGCLWNLSQHARDRVGRGLAGAVLAGLLAHQLFGLVDAIALGAKTGFIFWILLGLSARLFADDGSAG